ncbi:MAG: CBS domain-containing protein [Polyangiaceae bacterium]|nr:CBS domain-containing protein [Polyangiaceae bacterium]NUQ77161.1 CBS domain-containing protein [Polyangiaceae bacterium]
MKTLLVRDIMTSKVHSLGSDTKVAEAARMLTDFHVGGVPVVDGDRIVGVISKSDLVSPKSGLAQGGTRSVREVMTHFVLTVRPEDPVSLAISRMLDAGIHRVVVVGDGGKIAGILSSTDVLRAIERGERVGAEGAPPAAPAEKKADVVDLRTFEIRI